jgi:predicted transcriptional regulator
MNQRENSFMYFYEIADMLGLSTQTFRKIIKKHPKEDIRKLASKKGTGTYFYTNEEIKLILSEFEK